MLKQLAHSNNIANDSHDDDDDDDDGKNGKADSYRCVIFIRLLSNN